MMKSYVWNQLDPRAKRLALRRPASRRDPKILETVKQIFADVAERGFEGVSSWAMNLDQSPPRPIEIQEALVAKARAQVQGQDIEALEMAAAHVKAFAEAEYPSAPQTLYPREGLSLKRHYRPITTAGLYVPGGTAPLFSTLIMTAMPALVAKVPYRVCVSPPDRGGRYSEFGGLHPMMIVAAQACGLEAIWSVGGAQAIAGLSYGVFEGFDPADKLFGPGNAYVAEAKRYATEVISGLAIDMPAGPSELLVIIDETAIETFVAADLLSQAEHDTEAQVVLISLSPEKTEAVLRALETQLQTLPRANIARAALEQGLIFQVETRQEAALISNLYAPEHLSLQLKDTGSFIEGLSKAGTIFEGPYAAETFGDYISGPSHVLPTDGAARAYDGINVRSFLTSFVVQGATKDASAALAPHAARLARLEGLEAHALAADFRS